MILDSKVKDLKRLKNTRKDDSIPFDEFLKMKLIFVYNADSGKLNGLFDIAHKIVSPDTYQCSLCALTYGNFSEKAAWKTFRENSNTEMVFYHKDEFEQQYKQTFEYPVVLVEGVDHLEVKLNANQLNHFASLDALIKAIKNLT